MAGYDGAKPAGNITSSPVQNNASVNAACINPVINNANLSHLHELHIRDFLCRIIEININFLN
jgi:hypothetical protein